MKRTTNNFKRIPDAINCSPKSNFSMLPDEGADNENLSIGAKGLLWMLLRNKDGWTSYIENLLSKTSTGKAALNTALNELEREGYLWKINYVNKKTKQRVGSFWAYTGTQYQFDIDNELIYLEENELEPWTGNKKKPEPDFKVMASEPEPDFRDIAFRDIANRPPIILNKEKEEIEKDISPGAAPHGGSDIKKDKTERNKKYIPLAEKLALLIQTYKNMSFTQKQINQWANEFRRLEEENKVPFVKQRKVLHQYSKIVGNEFVPIVESGSSFRQKFIRIEEAIKRNNSPSFSKSNPQSNRYMPDDAPNYDRVDTIINNVTGEVIQLTKREQANA